VKQIEAVNLAGGEIAVFDPLAHVILINRFAKMAQVVGGQLRIGQALFGFLGHLELARRRRESDLYSGGIPREHL